MLRLSIVIPARGDIQRLEDGLVSVLENRPAETEVIVVLDRPYTDPYGLEGEVCFVHAARDAELAAIIYQGALASGAPLVHVLGCGFRVAENWFAQVERHFSDSQVAAVAPLVLDAFDERRVISAGIAYDHGGARRLRMSGSLAVDIPTEAASVLGPSLSAAFYRREMLLACAEILDSRLGGEMADVDLAWAIRDRGMRAVLEPRSRVFAAPAANRWTSAMRRGIEAERLFWRIAKRVGWPRALLRHPLVIAESCLACRPRAAAPLELAGRLVGLIPTRRRRASRAAGTQVVRAGTPTKTVSPSTLPGMRRIDTSHHVAHSRPAPPERKSRRTGEQENR